MLMDQSATWSTKRDSSVTERIMKKLNLREAEQ